MLKNFGSQKLKVMTRLGLQCQTPALSKVYFTWVGTIFLDLKKFVSEKNLLVKKFFSLQKIFDPPKNFGPQKF